MAETTQKSDTTATRTCAMSRTCYAKSEMIRFCVAPDGTLTPDIKGNLPGRGIWIHCSHINQAIKKNVFAKSARTQVIIPDTLMHTIDTLLYTRIIHLIHGAKRSGNALSGFETVKDALKSNALAIVFSSAEIESDGHKKLHGMCRMLNIMFSTVLSAQSTANIWGHTYAGIKKCGISLSIQNEIHRYGLFQNGDK